ncbi:hypothetical protein C8R41DRAFT_131690 [Lentinula lateritia]|uniref:Uncharacterized protein n=1 Tax=Lentinula lateritia TaxID=40482 RepID=A0ABQ8UWU5_9AGAR|nr:hypothetical protein C8R41DRAFT_131690 [Lentinula lateritia]
MFPSVREEGRRSSTSVQPHHRFATSPVHPSSSPVNVVTATYYSDVAWARLALDIEMLRHQGWTETRLGRILGVHWQTPSAPGDRRVWFLI